MKIERVEIWTNVKAASGTHEGNIPRDDLLVASSGESLDGKAELQLVINRASNAWIEIENERVFRVIYEDGGIGEFRIVKPMQKRNKQGAEKAIIKAVGIFMDLANGIISRDEANGNVTLYYTLASLTRTELVTLMVAAAPSHFAVGTITDGSTKVDPFTFNYDTPLKALQELAAMEELELAVRRNGDTNYLVDLITQIGSGATQPEFRYRKSLNGIERHTDSSKMANRIYPAGGDDGAIRLGLGEATWEVTAVPTATTVDLDGEPIFEDDQFNYAGSTFFLENVRTGNSYGISDTDVALQRITTSTHDFIVGDLVKFRADGAGKQVQFVESYNAQLSYGMKIGVKEENDLPLVDNLVVNAALDGWSGGNPDSWSAEGTPTIVENTSSLYTRVGGSSAKVTCDAIGEGIKSAAITIAPANPQVYFSGFVEIYVETGSVEFYFVHSTEGRFPLAGDEDAAITSENDKFVHLDIETGEWPAGTVTLYVVGLTATTEFYLDAAQFTNSAQSYPFFDGNAARKLWQRGLRDLADRINPIASYKIEAMDLYAIDPTSWPYDEITLGGDVLVEDEQLNLQVQTRVIEVKRNLLTAHPTAMALSNKPIDLVDILTRRHRRVRHETPVRASIAGIVNFVATHKNDGTVVLQLWGNKGCHSFKYIADAVSTMPTFSEVIESAGDGIESDIVDGTEVIVTTFRGTSVTELARGMRLLIRVVAFPIKSAEGVPGATVTTIVGPPSFWNCVIDDTEVTQTGSGASGTAKVHRSFEVTDKRVAGIRVYRKEGGWPTLDNTQSGAVDPDCDRGVIGSTDNWEYTDGGYSTNDSVRDVAVPVDNQGIEGERFDCAAYTVLSGAGGGDPRIASVFAGDTDQGTACGPSTMRDMRVYWTLENCNDTDHEIRITYTTNGYGPYTLGTEGDPVTNTTMDHDAVDCYIGGSEYYVVDHVVELWDVSGTPVKIDSKTASDPVYGAVWNVCSE